MPRPLRKLLVPPLVTSLALGASPALAHNNSVHQNLTDVAFQVMRLAAQDTARFTKPPEATAAEWQEYLQTLKAAVPRLRALPAGLTALSPSRCPDPQPGASWAANLTLGALPQPVALDYASGADANCGAQQHWGLGPLFFDSAGLPNDYTGAGLGFWAQSVDDETDDFHASWKVLNVGGLGPLNKLVSDAWEVGLGILLVPLVCLLNCLLGLFGSCEDCVTQAKSAAQTANPVTAFEGVIPGVGDVSGPDFVGMWHFINVRPGASNEYDDHQGMLYEEAGPTGLPGAFDVAIMAAMDVGLTLTYGKAAGIARYQVTGANDGHPDTLVRDEGHWELSTVGHTAFEPLDNLGFYGWRQFRGDPTHSARWLAWPLHAIGDATVPMHTVGTSAYGHRPFEDAQERLFHKLIGADLSLDQQQALMNQVLARGFSWYRFVRAWQAKHSAGEVPVRDLITALAERTSQYSQTTPLGWPYDDGASTAYFIDLDLSVRAYADRPDALTLGRPLVFDGAGATLAFLALAMEVTP